jgi:hypothetical protein
LTLKNIAPISILGFSQKLKAGKLMILAKIKRVFSRPTPLPKPKLDGLADGFYPETARRNVAKRSQGNVCLAQGNYRTQADIDAQFERVKTLDFQP